MAEPSIAAGSTDVALLDDTIDENFAATVAAHPHREALVVRPPAHPGTEAEHDPPVPTHARALVA